MGIKTKNKIDTLIKRISIVTKDRDESDILKNLNSYIDFGKHLETEIKNLIIKQEHIKTRIKKLQNTERLNAETSKILLNNGPTRISLILKKQRGNKYIKARCYWAGKQREVQIGPLQGIIKQLISLKLINNSKISLDINQNNTWDNIRSDIEIYNGIINLARLKLQKYILTRIDQTSIINNINDLSNVKKTIKEDIKRENVQQDDSWYESWRKRVVKL